MKMSKTLLVIVCLSLFSNVLLAQGRPDPYARRWKIVDSLIRKKGLTQSATTEVDKIYDQAKQEKNDPQLIKALIYRMGLQQMNQEDASQKSIAALEKEIGTAGEPARSILQSLLADAYWGYLRQNRWKLYNRTRTVNFAKDDIATWDQSEFNKKIGGLYLASIKNESLLKQTILDSYDPILLKGNVRYLRPTLFDLLGNRALEYFKTDESDINKPAYVFELDDPIAFADAATFAGYSFASVDTLSFKLQALQLYQRLIRFHLADAKPDALLDVDLDRLRFVNTSAVMNNKDSLYMAALTRITDRYGYAKGALDAWSMQAGYYVDQADAYGSSKDSADRYGYVKAKAICDQVLANSAAKDSSEGRNNCQELLKRILRKELSMNMEKVNLPGQAMRNLVSWRNVPQIYLRVVRIDRALQESLGANSYADEYWQKLLQLPALKTFSQTLPETGDYLQHRTEIRIDALPAGDYALVVSSGKDFSLAGPILAVQYFSVSGIAYVNTGRDYFVVNRESGQPLAGAAVQIWNRAYEYKTYKFTLSKAETYTTDDHGHFLLKKRAPKDANIQQWLEISTAGDHLFPDGQSTAYYLRYQGNDENDPSDKLAYERKYRRTFFFTDRAIYRPGQTLYFKGIVVTQDKDSRQSKVQPSFQTRVRLLNANGELVDSLDMTTNAFGSYHGKFTLPGNGLNGEFSIADDSADGRRSFSVEEYKRPKFYVEYDKLKGGYRVGDTIRVTGNAKAYAGNLIDGAKVKYRVVRQARFPYPWLYWRWGRPAVSEQEIAHGEATTTTDGKFTVAFAAIPDRKVSKGLDPVFEYSISADVTDINGETRSGQTTVSVGYKAIQLAIDLPGGGQHIPADSLKQLTVRTTNLSGEPEPSAIHMTIYSLQSPDRMIRKRYWDMPDQFVINKKDYLEAFPHDEYQDETKVESWQRTGKVAERLDSSGAVPIYRGEFPTGMRTGGKVNDQRLLPGWYAIEVTTTDKYGAEVKDIKYVELYDGKTGQPAYPQYNWGVEDNILAEPGSNATVDIGSSAGNVFVIRKVDHTITGNPIRPLVQAGSDDGDAAGPFNFLTLSKERKTTALPVTEGDRGGFGVLDVFVKDNRVYTNAHTILVPWSNKELKIDYTSFRDKTQPGSQERWTVNISGYKGDRVAAEVLASMYDASLDQFKMQYWNKPDLYPLYYPGSSWMSNDNFSMVNSLQKYFPDLDNLTYVKQYDQLLTAASPGAAGGVRHMMNTERSSDALLYKSAAPAPLAVLNGRVPGLAVSGVAQEAVVIRGAASMDTGNQPLYIVDGVIQSAADAKSLDPKEIEAIQILKGSAATSLYGASAAGGVVIITTKKGGQGARQEVQVRKNFNETAFFFPDLQTDAAGNVSFSFTMPEALTNWRLLTLAHTRELAFGFGERTVVTQKQLMLQPNAPRFLREGDRMELSTKIVNLTDSEMTGQVALELIDPTTGQTADGLFSNRQPNQYFTVGARQSAVVSFPIDIPYQYNRPLSYRMIARARNYSDGEEAALPVVSNRMLVTETLPLNMPGNGSRSFKFDKLLQSGNSETLNNHALTVEFTGNPTWYAVQALPYLIEYPYECAEQIFGRFYANALATKIVNSSPRIKAIFEQWKTADTAALLSNLQKNQELKSVLLEETPWVLQAKSESQQKKNIALLFDMVRMSREMDAALNKLQDMQSPNGGFVWFKGGEDNRYITQYILTGIGHLKKLNAIPASATEKIRSIVDAALPYLDQQVKKEYEEIKKKSPGAGKIAGPIQGSWGLPIYYLYMRSFFSDHGIPGDVFPAVNYFRKQTQASWLQQNKYLQGMIALSLYRTGDIKTAKDIMASLRQNAIRSEELGMYWKGMEAGYYWYQAPVETQSLLIEAFREVSPDAGIDRDLKTWLLRQKQTRSWSTTKSTADACYALLAGGENWLNVERNVEVKLGSMVVSSAGGGTGAGAAGSGGAAGVGSAGATAAGSAGTGTVAGSGTEAGTGYFKRVIDGAFVQPSMGNITVTLSPVAGTNSGKNLSGPPAWGAIYWQYFDNLDRITPPGGTKAPLKLTKKLFIQKNTDRGPVLEPVSENGTLHVGDKVKVRIELQADRDMEFVHMKDMRAAGMEPVNVISQYKWQGGLGYYESTKDVSTNFFFSWLPKGTYVFEYELFVGQVGNFSNGVTNIECMYAPEFASHSEGIRVNVEAVNP